MNEPFRTDPREEEIANLKKRLDVANSNSSYWQQEWRARKELMDDSEKRWEAKLKDRAFLRGLNRIAFTVLALAYLTAAIFLMAGSAMLMLTSAGITPELAKIFSLGFGMMLVGVGATRRWSHED
jgi:hypothetical protein